MCGIQCQSAKGAASGGSHQQRLCSPMRTRRPRGVRRSCAAAASLTPLPNRRSSAKWGSPAARCSRPWLLTPWQCSRLQQAGRQAGGVWGWSLGSRPAWQVAGKRHQAAGRNPRTAAAPNLPSAHLSQRSCGAAAASRAHARSDTRQSPKSRCSRERAAGSSASISASEGGQAGWGRQQGEQELRGMPVIV